MALEYTKLWLQQTLSQISQNRAQSRIHRMGRALPCTVKAVNGALVTVHFEINNPPFTLPDIEIPKAESPWIRMPTQVGDIGVTMAADAYIGALTLMGSGVATLAQPFSLSELVFVPISKNNDPPTDSSAAQISGPNGVICETRGTSYTSKVVVNAYGVSATFGSTTVKMDSSSITWNAGGKTMVLDSSGLTIDGILFDTHTHGGVTTGSGVTGGPQ